MNVVILTAAGVGSRMNNNIPKQFLTVNNKPVVLYTLEAFQNHPSIDMIVVACLKGWEPILQAYAKQYNITKLQKIVLGGNSGQESIYNCLKELKEICSDNDIIMVHDGNRPLINDEVINDSIAVCHNKGNAVAQIPCTEVIVTTKDQISCDKQLDRDFTKKTQTPHTFKFKEIYNGYKTITESGKTQVAAPCAVMMDIGKKIYFSNGSELNFKITTAEDLELFEAIIEKREREKK